MACGCQGATSRGAGVVQGAMAEGARIVYELSSPDGSTEQYESLSAAQASRMPGDTIRAKRRTVDPSPA